MNGTVDQERINEHADNLDYYIGVIEDRLEKYEGGEVSEKAVQKPAKKAVGSYEELYEMVGGLDVVEEMVSALGEHGYDSINQLVAGPAPITASDSNPAKDALDGFMGAAGDNFEEALRAMNQYHQVSDEALEYGIDLPDPDIDVADELDIMDDLENGGDKEEAVDLDKW
ncbi:MAG: hypothetical protein ABEJ72_03090 [Candidatus Aenigmatarchaeota archaeon]